MLSTIKKRAAFWNVELLSSGVTLFKSMSRKTATEWRDSFNALNDPLPAHERLNATAGVNVWRGRESA